MTVGCSTIARPTSEIDSARVAVLEAQAAAQPEAAYELALAQGKLASALRALQRGDYIGARIFAEQAEVDARYAWVVAEHARLQRQAR